MEKTKATSKPSYPKCKQCDSNSDVIPCVYGKPGSELLKKSKDGLVKLMGCIIREDRKDFFCKKCETFLPTEK